MASKTVIRLIATLKGEKEGKPRQGVFGKPTTARKFGKKEPIPLNFRQLKFSVKESELIKLC